MPQVTVPAAPNDRRPNHWLDMTDERLARDYIIPHAGKAEDAGRHVCHAALMEAARRLLGRPYWLES